MKKSDLEIGDVVVWSTDPINDTLNHEFRKISPLVVMRRNDNSEADAVYVAPLRADQTFGPTRSHELTFFAARFTRDEFLTAVRRVETSNEE